MALTSTITLDLVGSTQILNYYQGASLVDTITYSSNQITFASSSGFNLSKGDTILYNTFLTTYFTALVLNFPIVSKSNGLILPLCNFQISETSQGVTHLNYAQSSMGTTVLAINYLPLISSAAFSARSMISISIQEFFLLQIMLQQYINQVGLN